MTQNQQTSNRKPGGFSLWMQRKMNARMIRKVRKGRSQFMGMEVLILHTVGSRSGQPRETPVSWYTDDDGGRLIVASGGGEQNPAWYSNLMAHPGKASIEMPDGESTAVMLRELDGAERDQAWQRILAARPQYEKYQSKTARQYPIIRLTPQEQ